MPEIDHDAAVRYLREDVFTKGSLGWEYADHVCALADEAKRLAEALEELHNKYVVDLYGANCCDCDPSVGIESCAPCQARAALASYRERK